MVSPEVSCLEAVCIEGTNQNESNPVDHALLSSIAAESIANSANEIPVKSKTDTRGKNSQLGGQDKVLTEERLVFVSESLGDDNDLGNQDLQQLL